MARAKVLYNDDSTELWDVEPGRAVESLKELIDRVVDNVPIDIYAIECALPDMCEYETKVGEVVGRRFTPPHPPSRQRCRGIDALRAEGTDHLSVYVEHLHDRGIQCVAEMRMSDTHHRRVAPDEYGCPVFTLEHPKWVIKRDDGVEEVAMDYSYPEVREHRLAILTELANDYDTDGLELNFIRWGKHFEKDKGREKASIMTEHIANIRRMLDAAAKRRGSDRLLLGVRMPSTIEECWLEGADVRTWVENGWIDYVVAAEYNDTWPGTRVDEFVPFCKGRCEVYAQMGNIIGSSWKGKPVITGRGEYLANDREPGYVSMRINNEEARGAAANYSAWGADGISFWNISCSTGTRGKGNEIGPEHRARMFAWMNEAIDPARVEAGKRTYHYVPLYKGLQESKSNYFYHGNLQSPLGGVRSQVLEFPAEDRGKRKAFRFRMADGRNGEKLAGTLRFRVLHCGQDAEVTVDVNGTVVEADKIGRTVDPANEDVGASWFELSLEDCPALRGDKELGLTCMGEGGDKVPYMEELEARVG